MYRCRPLAWPTGNLRLVCRRRGLWRSRYRSALYWWSLVSGRIWTPVTTGSELSMDTVSVPWAEPPSASRGDATENVVAWVYDGRRQVSSELPKRYSWAYRFRQFAWPTGSLGLVCPPSGSVVLVVTLVSGRICTSVTTGSELSMVTVSVPWAEPPSASVAVTRQRILSPGSTTEGRALKYRLWLRKCWSVLRCRPLAHW